MLVETEAGARTEAANIQDPTSNIRVQQPFPTRDWPRVWMWIERFRWRLIDDFGPTTLDAFVEQQISAAATAETWAVYRDGELGGMVWIDRASEYLAVAHCVFKKEFWGRETTERALRLVFAEVFASGVGKICSHVFADNFQILALIRSLGGQQDGRAREHTIRQGKPVDMISIGILKREFYESQNGNRSGADGPVGDIGAVRQETEIGHDADVLAGTAGAAIVSIGDAHEPAEQSGEPQPAEGSGSLPS